MKLYSKVLALMICCLFVSVVGSFAAAQNVYIAQVATGGADGSSCANAYAIGFFNSSGNWGTGPAQIGPGTTVHLCGTITTMLTFQGSGNSQQLYRAVVRRSYKCQNQRAILQQYLYYRWE